MSRRPLTAAKLLHLSPRQKRELQAHLLAWYARLRRKLPWRESRDPYAIWVSEIMLHQTQVKTVLPYYRKFLKRFPSLRVLATSPLEAVLKIWQGMGYYARARHLHQAARVILSKHGEKLPEDFQSLTKLPGVGEYTAGAILSIAFGKPYPALDGNVKRVLARLFALEGDPGRAAALKHLRELARGLLPRDRPGDFNQALMELGALVCRPKDPACPSCPLKNLCGAKRLGHQNQIPPPLRRTPPKEVEVVSLFLTRGTKILLVQNPKEGLFGGLWGLPGGDRRPGRGLTLSLQEALKERLGVSAKGLRKVANASATLTHRRISFHIFRATDLLGTPRPQAYQACRWLKISQLSDLPLPKAQRRVLAQVLHKVDF